VFANFGKAIEAYERKLVDKSSQLRLASWRGPERDVGRRPLRGAKLFVGKAACNECHSGR
jgi:cytochrome c peroxidase